MNDPLLTVAEVAARWRVHRRTIVRMLDRGDLDGVRIGGQIRVRPESVDAYEAAHRTASRVVVSPRREEAWR